MVIQPEEKIDAGAFDQLDPPDPELYLDCIHCGFCLPTCPTYLVLGNEMDSPRGRLYLIRTASEGKIGASDSFVKHMDLCLLCRACETACPSGDPAIWTATGPSTRLRRAGVSGHSSAPVKLKKPRAKQIDTAATTFFIKSPQDTPQLAGG